MLILVVYGVAGLLLIGLAVAVYMLSVQTRKSYHCPACGETQRVEHMGAHHCNMCGAPLKEDAI